jgi:membrane-bound serine protease (ClpP class)
MFRRLALPILASLAVLLTGAVEAMASAGSNGPPLVLQVRLENESISPITARFVQRAIEQAERERAACLVIVLDTPGGLVESTRSIVKRILRSEVPVVVFVAPAGARAASAGMFITLAGHIAAMAPGANIGAAHPVQIGGLPISPRPEGKEDGGKTTPARPPAEEKSVNDTVAWARSLAELRGRNADWAARAVRESASATASEAVREQAVDLLAQDVNDLLAKIDGREVTLPSAPCD